MKTIKTRFAPSPTGYLHIGGLRTALYAYLFAKQNDGIFLLRIEDTDQKRLVENSLQNIIDTLLWAGLKFDEGPFIQSERLEIYQQHANQLLESNHAYRCFCTSEELTAMKEEQMATKKAPMYDRRCRHLNSAEIEEKLKQNQPFVIRQSIPLNKTVKFIDKIRGKMTFDTNTLDDHVLLKSDGFPTYHLAVVVDDHLMEITDVIRGEEWLPSTPKHILLYQSFNWEPTTFAHLPLLLNKDRSKLSKRQNDVSTQSYIDKGYIKEALINFIAMLGWNTSDNQEIYSIEDLITHFSLERVQKAGAIFDLDKLNWYNWQWNKLKYQNQLIAEAKKINPQVEIQQPQKGKLNLIFSNQSEESQFQKIVIDNLLAQITAHLSKKNLKHLTTKSDKTYLILKSVEEKILKEPTNINSYIAFYFEPDLNYTPNLFTHEKMQVDTTTAINSIKTTIDHLAPTDFASEHTLKTKFETIIKTLKYKNGQVLWPVRVAITNQEYSPGVFEVAYILQFEETMKRLNSALLFLQKQ